MARELIARIVLKIEVVAIHLGQHAKSAPDTEHLAASDTYDPGGRVFIVPIRLVRRGGAVRLLDPTGRRIVDRPEVDVIAKGWRLRGQLLSGDYSTSVALAKTEGITQTSLNRSLRLAYLSPDLAREILDGRQRPGLTVGHLFWAEISLEWEAQRRLFAAPRAT